MKGHADTFRFRSRPRTPQGSSPIWASRLRGLEQSNIGLHRHCFSPVGVIQCLFSRLGGAQRGPSTGAAAVQWADRWRMPLSSLSRLTSPWRRSAAQTGRHCGMVSVLSSSLLILFSNAREWHTCCKGCSWLPNPRPWHSLVNSDGSSQCLQPWMDVLSQGARTSCPSTRQNVFTSLGV